MFFIIGVSKMFSGCECDLYKWSVPQVIHLVSVLGNQLFSLIWRTLKRLLWFRHLKHCAIGCPFPNLKQSSCHSSIWALFSHSGKNNTKKIKKFSDIFYIFGRWYFLWFVTESFMILFNQLISVNRFNQPITNLSEYYIFSYIYYCYFLFLHFLDRFMMT